MNKLKDLNKTVVLSDFDGTITTFDTNVRLFNKFGFGVKETIERLEQKYYNGEINLKELHNGCFRSISLSKEQYLDYILKEVELQKGFSSLYGNLKERNIPFSIVSSGFKTGIKPFLIKHGFEGIPIYANRLIFEEERAIPVFYDEEFLSHVVDGDHYVDCKVEILRGYRERYDSIIFLGDGATDIQIAKEVDILFAKDYLEEYCIENNIDYFVWKDFYDIDRWLNS